jgi:hypothetical protein
MSEEIFRIIKEKEEQVLRQVLFMCLDREPELEDAKRLTKGIVDGMEGYRLAFDNVHIGDVVFDFPIDLRKSETFSVKFIPISETIN